MFGFIANALRDSVNKPTSLVNQQSQRYSAVTELVSDTIADSKQAVILEQVTNGIAVRMAVLYLLIGNGEMGKNK